MDAVDRFIDAFNAGDFETMRSLMADGYSYAEPLYPGPYDAEGHIAVMRGVLDRSPDRRMEVIERIGGVGAVAVRALWTGTMPAGGELRLEGVYILELTDDRERITGGRAFYGAA